MTEALDSSILQPTARSNGAPNSEVAASREGAASRMRESFQRHLEFSLAKDEYSATERDCFHSLALAARDRLIDKWMETQQTYYNADAKRVYYLSLEFLMGRLLGNTLVSQELVDAAQSAMATLGHSLEELRDVEFDAGLGNGGLGRLAACLLDSMATAELPAYGYGIRYEYGIFYQRIVNGFQQETPDNWLRYGNPWEIPRAEYLYPVQFYGRVNQYIDEAGKLRTQWLDSQQVMAMAYDTPVPGYMNNTVNTMRLWSAKSSREFDLNYFNYGDYEKAVADKSRSETISRVLYPNDNFFVGRELRLRQQYFFVSATLQDAMRRYKKYRDDCTAFAEKTAIHLNDTHPAIAIPELMRIFLDEEGLGWEEAWSLCLATFAYTNHTVLPEALEKWPVSLMDRVLPRHMQLIYEINRRFLDEVRERFPNDPRRVQRMSIIEEGEEKTVRMAHLAIVGSHAVNGVAELHTHILKTEVFVDFDQMWPGKFINITNGITPRRWLRKCNPELGELITSRIGRGWITDLGELRRLTPFSDDPEFQDAWRRIKRANKERLALYVKQHDYIEIDPDSLFDCQVKRIHEYKRQLLNGLHLITLLNRIKANPKGDWVARTSIFGGKAAPGYYRAKLIIKLINGIAERVDRDHDASRHLRVVFMANYGVSVAEKIIPAADLSEQISLAGTEASGTSNMKFALNGALTIGTLDGANVEIRDEVGADNIFIFGLTTPQVAQARAAGYNPRAIYERNPELKAALDSIARGDFSPEEPDLFVPMVESLLNEDPYLLLADYDAYVSCQERVSALYRDSAEWTRKSILNVAGSGKFSSDRTVGEYASRVWGVKPVHVVRRDELIGDMTGKLPLV